MVQRFGIGAEVVKPSDNASLFSKVREGAQQPNSTPSRTTTKWPFALSPTDRMPEGRGGEGEGEEELSSLVFRALRNCGIKFRRRRRRPSSLTARRDTSDTRDVTLVPLLFRDSLQIQRQILYSEESLDFTFRNFVGLEEFISFYKRHPSAYGKGCHSIRF